MIRKAILWLGLASFLCGIAVINIPAFWNYSHVNVKKTYNIDEIFLEEYVTKWWEANAPREPRYLSPDPMIYSLQNSGPVFKPAFEHGIKGTIYPDSTLFDDFSETISTDTQLVFEGKCFSVVIGFLRSFFTSNDKIKGMIVKYNHNEYLVIDRYIKPDIRRWLEQMSCY